MLFYVVIDNCQSSPCQNAGTCTNDVNKYTCTCQPGYTGANCQSGEVCIVI